MLQILNQAQASLNARLLFTCGLLASYFFSGLMAERLYRAGGRFLAPLYATAHLLTALALIIIYSQPLGALVFNNDWPQPGWEQLAAVYW